MGRSASWLMLSLLALLLSAPVSGQQAPRQISLYIGSTTGGGYDQYGRLLARYLGRYLPGAPAVVPRNMPGGGGREVMNYIAAVAQRDGSAIAVTQHDVPFDPLLNGGEAARFDAPSLTWIGSMNSEVSLCVSWAAVPVRALADLRSRPLIVGSSGPDSASAIRARLLNRIAGTRLKLVEGYPGSTEIHLAMERGEVEGRCGLAWDSILSRYRSWLDQKQIVLLVQLAIDKHPDLADVPFIMDLAAGEPERQMAALILAPNKMGRPFFAPPGLPAERAQLLRRAFEDSMRDPALRADAAKMDLEIDWITGAETEALVKRLYATPAEVVQATRAILNPN